MKIYCIENKINGKKYIGMTKGSIQRRFKSHKEIAKYKEKKQHLHKAMLKYGIENFVIVELDQADSKEELIEKEKYWIKKLNTKNNGYNETDGGEGTWGWKPTPEKQKILNEKQKQRYIDNPELRLKESIKAKERWNNLSEEEKQKRLNKFNESKIGNKNALNKKWKLSEKTKKKMSESKKGWIMPEETRKKISEIKKNHTGWKHSPETIEKMRQAALNRKKVGT